MTRKDPLKCSRVKRFQISRPILAAGLAALCLVPCGCGTAKVSRQQTIGAAPAGRPQVIYVADFELDASNVKSESGSEQNETRALRYRPT